MDEPFAALDEITRSCLNSQSDLLLAVRAIAQNVPLRQPAACRCSSLLSVRIAGVMTATRLGDVFSDGCLRARISIVSSSCAQREECQFRNFRCRIRPVPSIRPRFVSRACTGVCIISRVCDHDRRLCKTFAGAIYPCNPLKLRQAALRARAAPCRICCLLSVVSSPLSRPAVHVALWNFGSVVRAQHIPPYCFGAHFCELLLVRTLIATG